MPASISVRGSAVLRYLPISLPSGPMQHGDVVDQVPVALDEPRHHVQPMLARQPAKVIRRRPGHRLRRVAIREAVARGGDRLGQHHQVRLLPRGLGDQRRELAATVHPRLPAVRHVMHRRQPHLARRRRRGLGEHTSLHSTRARGAQRK